MTDQESRARRRDLEDASSKPRHEVTEHKRGDSLGYLSINHCLYNLLNIGHPSLLQDYSVACNPFGLWIAGSFW